MSEESKLEQLKDKLNRALRSKAVLTERSKLLTDQLDDYRNRENQSNQLVMELLERQREMNFMLHRANSVLHHLQDANAALSTEFTELVKELPAPQIPEWEQRVSKINELFKKTGKLADEVQQDIFGKSPMAEPDTNPEPEKPQNDSEVAFDTPEPVQATAEALEAEEDAHDVVDDIEYQVEEVVEAVIIEEVHDDDDRKKKLFDSINKGQDVDAVASNWNYIPSSVAAKPNVISRIWSKLTGHDDDDDSDGGSAVEADSQSEQVMDASEELKAVNLFSVSQPIDRNHQHLQNLWDDNDVAELENFEILPSDKAVNIKFAVRKLRGRFSIRKPSNMPSHG